MGSAQGVWTDLFRGAARAIHQGSCRISEQRNPCCQGDQHRATGLVHRIDPVLRRCLPADKPAEEEIKRSLKFLLDEWLVDVALDQTGKCVAILLALTLLQRALLPERPAFFVTAGQRGG